MTMMTRRGLFRRGMAAAATLAVAPLSKAVDPAPVLDDDPAPGWTEEWPPSAHPQALVGVTDGVCSTCGKIHGWYTAQSTCLPVLFAPPVLYPDLTERDRPGGRVGGAILKVPPKGLRGLQLTHDGPSRIVQVRDTDYRVSAIDPACSVDPASWGSAGVACFPEPFDFAQINAAGDRLATIAVDDEFDPIIFSKERNT